MWTSEGPLHYLEVVAPDVEAACAAYAATYGWTFGDPVPELGQARVAVLPGGLRWGIRAPMHEVEAPVTRAYAKVADLEAALAAAEAAGARILLGAMPMPGHGRIAIVEIGGVQQGLWEVPVPT